MPSEDPTHVSVNPDPAQESWGQDKCCSMWLSQVSPLLMVFQIYGESLARQTCPHGSPTLINLALCYNGKMTGLQFNGGSGWVFCVQRGMVPVDRSLPPVYHRYHSCSGWLLYLSAGKALRGLSTVQDSFLCCFFLINSWTLCVGVLTP